MFDPAHPWGCHRRRIPDRVVFEHAWTVADGNVTRWLLDELGFEGEIARKGMPSPIQVGKRRVVERTNSWMNGYGRLRRMTDKDGQVVDLHLYLADTGHLHTYLLCLLMRIS